MKKKTKEILTEVVKGLPNAQVLLGITALILLALLAYVLILYFPRF